MKKLVALLLVIIIFCCSGCGEKSSLQKAKSKIIQIGEQYLNYDLTSSEAKEKLEGINVPETEGHGKLFLDSDKWYLEFCLRKGDYTGFEESLNFVKECNYEE